MAYVPPHKRKGNEGKSPTAEMLTPPLRKNLNRGSLGLRHSTETSPIGYSANAVSRWLAVGLNSQEMEFPPPFILQRVPLERIEQIKREKPFMLVNNDSGVNHDTSEKPWTYIAERVVQDLVSSSEYMKTQTEERNQKSEETRLKLVARVGRVLFLLKRNSFCEGDPGKYSASEASLKQSKRTFCTNVPASFMKTVINEIVPNTGFVLKDLKEVYSVKLADKCRPGETISCKCRVVKEGKRLDIYKIELNQIRHMVYEISCLKKVFDLSLMLSAKRTLTSLMHDDEESIRNFIDLAVFDSNAKGGLTWSTGNASSSGERYQVKGVLHTVSRSYTSHSMRLKVQDADWFGFRTSVGEVLGEIILKFKEIPAKLLENNIASDSVFGMLEGALKFLWENFLHSD